MTKRRVIEETLTRFSREGFAALTERVEKMETNRTRLEAENRKLREALHNLEALATVLARESADRVRDGDEGIEPARALLHEIDNLEGGRK
jgi:regulator of replication initiation timing